MVSACRADLVSPGLFDDGSPNGGDSAIADWCGIPLCLGYIAALSLLRGAGERES